MSDYENAPAAAMLATHCCCGRPLLDAVSVEAGIGPDCRKKHGFDEAQTAPDWAAVARLELEGSWPTDPHHRGEGGMMPLQGEPDMTTPKNTERPNIPCAWVNTHELPSDNIVRLTLSLVLAERRTVRATALRFLADLEAASPPESSWFIVGPTHIGVARRRSVWTIEMHLAGLDYWTDARAVACKVCHDFNAAANGGL